MLADLKARLEAALGDTPVLAPEDRMKPLEGDKPGPGPKGLARYFLSHPGGFVQIGEPSGLTSTGYSVTHLVPIDVIAPTRAAALALETQVRQALHAYPGGPPTPYALLTPPNERAQVGAFVLSSLYQARQAFEPHGV